MRILIVVSDLGLGGAQKVAISLANGLAEKFPVYLYDIAPEVRRPDVLKEISYKVCIIKHDVSLTEKIFLKLLYAILSRLPNPKEFEKKVTYLEKQWFIRRFVKDNKIDVINTHLWWADKFIVETFKGAPPCSLVISSHGDHWYFFTTNKIPGFRKQLKEVFSLASYITYLSDNFLSVISQLQLSPTPKLAKVINGFNFDAPKDVIKLQEPKRKHTFILASRATEDKGWKEAIETVILLHQNGFTECDLLLAGDGDLLPELQKKYPKEKYPYIVFLGFVSNVLSYINYSDVVLLPAYHEQLPTFILEGLFLGRPVIATDVGEVRNMITHNNEPAGILIPLKNGKPDREELYTAMLNLMSNEVRRTEFSIIAKKSYEKYNYETFLNQYQTIFSNALNKD